MRAWRLALLVPLLAACGGGGGDSASYVGTASDTAVYVTWKRSDKALTGELTRALAGSGVKTDRVGFTGTADGSSVSLRLAHPLGARSTLNGALSGDTLTLDYPGQGDVSTIRLREADGKAFDRELASLRTRAADVRQAADAPAELADAVREQIRALTAAAGAGRLDALMKTLRASYASVVSDQAYNYTDTICDDVGAVDAQVKSLKAAASGAASASSSAADVAELRHRFDQLKALPASQLPAEAPTQREVDAAIAAATRPAGRGSEVRARSLLAAASAMQAKADAACRKANGG